MRIGVPAETKDQEYRVGLVPDGVRSLVSAGHEVLVERGAGLGSGLTDAAYEAAGATLVATSEAWTQPELIIKVKEPNPKELTWLHEGQTLFAYLHLAANSALVQRLREAGVIAIAYETMEHADGTLPLLAPMSEVAGRLATQIGVSLLQKDRGGKGVLVGGIPGVPRGKITVLGAGIVGINAVRVAKALGATVDVLDIDARRLSYIYDLFGGQLNTLYSTRTNIERSVATSDLVIGAVYLRGRSAPKLVTRGMIASMEPGSVVLDVAVDQGGCMETTRETSHSNPTYVVHGVTHYGVPNIPGAVPRTSTFALTNMTLHYLEILAAHGVKKAVQSDPVLASGVNIWKGKLTCLGVAESLALPYSPLASVLAE